MEENEGRIGNEDFNRWNFFILNSVHEAPFLLMCDYENEVFFRYEENCKEASYQWFSTVLESDAEPTEKTIVCDRQGRNSVDLFEEENKIKRLSETAKNQKSIEEWHEVVPDITLLEDLIAGQQEIAEKNPSVELYFAIANNYQKYGLEYYNREDANQRNTQLAFEASIYYAFQTLVYAKDEEINSENENARPTARKILRYIYARYKDMDDCKKISAVDRDKIQEIMVGLQKVYFERYGENISEQRNVLYQDEKLQ